MKMCPKCHAQVEEGSKFCDSCGAQIPDEVSVNVPETIYCPHCGSLTAADSAFCANCGKQVEEAVFCENCGQKADGSGNICQNCGTQLYEQVYCPDCGAPSTSEAAFCKKCGRKLKEEPVTKKKERKLGGAAKKVLLVAVPVLVLAVLIGCFFSSAANFVRRTFSSPERYFAYTMKKSLKENAGTAANLYNSLVKERMNYSDRSEDVVVTLKLSEDIRELIEDTGALDETQWLEEMQIRTGVSVKDKIFSANGALRVGKEEILSGNVVFNTEDSEIYAQIPVLSDKYIGVNLEDSYDAEELDAVFASLADLYEAYPDKDAVERLLYKYSTLAISCIDEVEKGKDTVEAGGVSQKCTTLQLSIRSKTLQTMAETVLKEMKQDEELKEMIKKLSKVEGLGDMEDLYDNYRDAIDDALDNLDYLEIDGRIAIDVYVNNKGELIGFRMKNNGGKAFFAETQKGKNFGTEFSVETDYYEMKLEGSGKKSGGKKSGEYTWKINGSYGESYKLEFRTEDIDVEAWKNGNMKGTVILPLKGFGDLLDVDLSVFRRYDLAMVFDTTQSEGKIDVFLRNDKENVASLLVEFKSGSGKKADMPGKSEAVMIEDADDLEDWLDTVDIDDLIDKLEKADMPSELIDGIEDAYDSLSYYTPWWGSSRGAAEAPAAAESPAWEEPAEEAPAEESSAWGEEEEWEY